MNTAEQPPSAGVAPPGLPPRYIVLATNEQDIDQFRQERRLRPAQVIGVTPANAFLQLRGRCGTFEVVTCPSWDQAPLDVQVHVAAEVRRLHGPVT